MTYFWQPFTATFWMVCFTALAKAGIAVLLQLLYSTWLSMFAHCISAVLRVAAQRFASSVASSSRSGPIQCIASKGQDYWTCLPLCALYVVGALMFLGYCIACLTRSRKQLVCVSLLARIGLLPWGVLAAEEAGRLQNGWLWKQALLMLMLMPPVLCSCACITIGF